MKDLVSELYARSRAAEFGIPGDDFSRILDDVLNKNLAAGDDGESAVRQLLGTLRLEELALAQGCAIGHEKAWEIFLTRYRETLYDMAHSIAKDDSIARDLADNIFADLYGTSPAGGERISKLRSYSGIGSLAGWLRAVMARAYIDVYRSGRRTVSLEDEQEFTELPAPPETLQTSVDSRLQEATSEALASLPAEDRFLLASYFLDGRTLAEVARSLGVHESTASRKVEKVTTGLRKKIRDSLLRRGMSRAQAEEALEADVRDLEIDVAGRLKENLQEPPSDPFSQRKAGAKAATKKGL
ncbi:MAG: RNA polymerase sigma factor [Candidatus Korobacteraceae bacterium]